MTILYYNESRNRFVIIIFERYFHLHNLCLRNISLYQIFLLNLLFIYTKYLLTRYF